MYGLQPLLYNVTTTEWEVSVYGLYMYVKHAEITAFCTLSVNVRKCMLCKQAMEAVKRQEEANFQMEKMAAKLAENEPIARTNGERVSYSYFYLK